MHLHSNIQFEDNDGSEQYYHKNQTLPPPLSMNENDSFHTSHISTVAGMPTPHDVQNSGPSIMQPPNLSSIHVPQAQPMSQFSQGSQGPQGSQIPYLNNPSSSKISIHLTILSHST